MLNEFKHLDNGLTCIYVKSGRKKVNPFVEAYIDTDDFEIVDAATTELWSLWQEGITANCSGTFKKMSRIITKVSDNNQKIVIAANGNLLDLRKENLVVGNQGDLSRASFQAKLSNIAKSLKPLPSSEELNPIIKDNELAPTLIHHPLQKTLIIEKNLNTDHISFTVDGKKRVLSSLNEKDTKTLIEILNDLNVTIG